MKEKPWVSGPSEILQHALSLLSVDNDTNRRLAFLGIDNSVELMIKTYLSLPTRVTKIEMSKKTFDEISESFPKLLIALEEYKGKAISEVDLGEIEWYHRLRNQLYHQGNGLTVEKEKVENYAELAKVLFKNLFGFDFSPKGGKDYDILVEFLLAWEGLEENIKGMFAQIVYGDDVAFPDFSDVMEYFEEEEWNNEKKYISDIEKYELEKILNIRTGIINGALDYRVVLTSDLITKTKELAGKLSR